MIILDSILETVAEHLDDEVKSFSAKLLLSIAIIILFLFIVAGITTIGFGFIDKNLFLGLIFILIAIVIFVFFIAKFIIVYGKKMNKKISFISKLFKVEKKK